MISDYWRRGSFQTLQIVKAKTCQNCCRAVEAMASNRTILICDHKQGCQGKFFVVGPENGCRNFKPSQTPPPPQSDGARFIPLTQGKFAIVDAEDYDLLAKYKWYCQRSGNRFYALRRNPQRQTRTTMHRQILHAPEGLFVDHIDGDGLNNRKSNLRLCSAAQNAWNRRPDRHCYSGYKGVTWSKNHKKWHAHITKAGKGMYLGHFDDQLEAALAYDRKAEQLFREFAYLNFPLLVEFRKFARKIIFSE